MKYQDLIQDLSDQTGLSTYLCREVMSALPKALTKLEEGDKVRTPLGVFLWQHLHPRPVKMANGKVAQVRERLKLNLRPGKSTTIEKDDALWPFIAKDEDED